MSLLMPLSRKLSSLLLLPLFAIAGEQGPSVAKQIENSEIERIVGNQIENSLEVISWKADKPQQTNLIIYSVKPPKLDEVLLRRVADRFSMTGEVKRITGETLGNVGYAIKETNPIVQSKPRSVFYWETMGNFGYDTGDDGYRFNRVTKRHEVHGVPDKEEAKQEALKFLPVLDLSTNDLEHYSNGRLRWASSPKTISYNDKEDKQRKTLITARNLTFYQRIPSGGITTGVGDAGQLRFTFVSEGKVASIEWFFRGIEEAGKAKAKTVDQVIRDLRERNAYTWHQNVPSSLTITNCVVAYPQGNSWLYQKQVWPFYMINGIAFDGRAVTLYVPLER